MSIGKLADAMRNAELLYDEQALDEVIGEMADAIVADYSSDDVPLLFVTVMKGGLHFAAKLSFALAGRGLDVEFDYLHATRYRGRTSGSGLAWLHRPETPMRGRRVLLVDDILDEGYTLQAVQRWCEDQNARDVRIAVLTEKRHDRRIEGVEADYCGVEVPDRYVFGYGMDYHEQGRNLPAIYALVD
ncbi:MAG TPA: hypoxanthine-guanine phosphoribosyltransferase [Candidatus Luteimonas excrementigallinarum]|nr:hypoxanthine-guanine phosphoribosyltransferase [Candidatus Luteimonas excrementigallinarum]